MAEHGERRDILMKGYGDLRLLEDEHGTLEITQEDVLGGEPSTVFIAREQLATLVAFIRQMKPEGGRS